MRELVFTSDVGRCLGEPAGVPAIVMAPRPHWSVGDAALPTTPAPSLVLLRVASPDEPPHTFVPARHLAGLLPAALVDGYTFWQRRDLSMVGRRSGSGGGAPTGGGGTADELHIAIDAHGAVVRRVPLAPNGVPLREQGRRLLSSLTAPIGSGLSRLVSLLERLEDLKHVLLWAPHESAGGSDGDLPLELVELPRLGLTFEARRAADGAVLLHSCEHPGLHVGWLDGERGAGLLRGLPHALVLRNEEGEAFVLLSALAKPCRLFNPNEPLSAQLLLSRNTSGWADGLAGVRHYLFPVHRSQLYLIPPSLAATLTLLVLRWLARDFDAAMLLCGSCASDTPLTTEEAQLWALLADFEDDAEPEAHALRLKLQIATRCCAELPCPWDASTQLPLYIAKLDFIPPSCQLPAPIELQLMRGVLGSALPAGLEPRAALLEAALANAE
eukprot:5103669-Prymnesium_polylepis.1